MTIEPLINFSGSRPAASDEGPQSRIHDGEDFAFLTLHVRIGDGARHRVQGAEGFRLMELIRAQGLPIKAECGGAGVCATCHVRVSQAWLRRLPEPTDEELAKLDEIPSADDRSRLACQVVMSNELDGLELELDADSLIAQAIRVAG